MPEQFEGMLAEAGIDKLCPYTLLRDSPFVKKSEIKTCARRPSFQNKSFELANERVLRVFIYGFVYQHLVLIFREGGMADAPGGGAVLIARGGR